MSVPCTGACLNRGVRPAGGFSRRFREPFGYRFARTAGMICSPILWSAVVLGFDRMLWYAREGAHLVHAGEAIALSDSDETESMQQAYQRLADLASERQLPGVQRFFADEVHRMAESKLEALMSGLWRLQNGVLELFSLPVRAMVRRP